MAGASDGFRALDAVYAYRIANALTRVKRGGRSRILIV
jgi:hypothetical protein